MRQNVDHTAKFLKLVQFRAPETLAAAIDSAATKHFQSKSEYVRRSVVDRLKTDGIDPAQTGW